MHIAYTYSKNGNKRREMWIQNNENKLQLLLSSSPLKLSLCLFCYLENLKQTVVHIQCEFIAKKIIGLVMND